MPVAIEDEVRSGVAGAWDRFVGPQASRIESAGTLAAIVAAALWGDAGSTHRAAIGRRLLMRTVNTRACVRWYERPGQGRREHLHFAALHLLHPALIAVLDHAGGTRGRAAALRWVLAHYGWMLAAAATITSLPHRARLPVTLVASGTGVILDQRLGISRAAPWFVPVYYTKLLFGHSAGSVWNTVLRSPPRQQTQQVPQACRGKR